MTNSNVDIQCQKISRGINTLLELLSTKLIKQSLEIGLAHASSENYDLLNRLERSIDQYIKRDKNLFYVGLMGNFSSGKSSTINSILSLWGTPDERKGNQNPTDTGITLITNKKNKDYVINSVRGGRVPVIVTSVEDRTLLENIVIIDTPGFGDPSTLEEVVRDSLPLCDLIVYCFSGGAPLTTSDIPLLKEKEKNLKEIPTLFVVTRASEFKANALEKVSDSNLDKSKAIEILTGLAARMKITFVSYDLSADDFILIDNLDLYNVNHLINTLLEKSNPINMDNVIKLHSHKVNYFIRVSGEIKSFFLNNINDQLTTIEEFVKKAEKNIQEYDEQTKIGTDTLNESFRYISKTVVQVLDGAINENIRVRDLLSTPQEFINIEIVKEWKKEVLDSIERIYSKEMYEIKNTVTNQLYDIKEKAKQEIYNLSLAGTSISKTVFNEKFDELNHNLVYTINTEFLFYQWYFNIFTKIKRFLEVEKKVSIVKNIESIQNRIRLKSPLDSIQKNIIDANKSLSVVFKSYDDAVKIYRVAALANETKMFIKKLGLSEEFDTLDSSPINIDDAKESAFSQIFKPYEAYINNFKIGCTSLEERLKSIKVNLHNFDLDNSESKIVVLQDQILIEFQEVVNKSINDLKSKMKVFYLDKIDSIQSTILEREIAKDKELAKLEKLQNIYYVKKIIPAFLLLLMTFSLFYFFPKYNLFQQLNTAQQWLFGIIVNFSSFLFSILYAKRKDRYPTAKLHLESSFHENNKELINKVIDEEYFNVKEKNISNLIDMIRIESSSLTSKNMVSLLSMDINGILLKNHDLIVANEKELRSVISSYTTLLENLKQILISIFSNQKNNKDILFEQSIEIKRKRINPSFELLFSTKTRISDVKTKIEVVNFI